MSRWAPYSSHFHWPSSLTNTWLYLMTCQIGTTPFSGSSKVLKPTWYHMPLAVFMSGWTWMTGVVISWMAQLPG